MSLPRARCGNSRLKQRQSPTSPFRPAFSHWDFVVIKNLKEFPITNDSGRQNREIVVAINETAKGIKISTPSDVDGTVHCRHETMLKTFSSITVLISFIIFKFLPWSPPLSRPRFDSILHHRSQKICVITFHLLFSSFN